MWAQPWLQIIYLLVNLLAATQANLFRSKRALSPQWTRNNVSNYLNNIINNNNNNDDSQSSQPQCCACDEAKYELVFEALWSKHTHPDEFPENGELAKFGDVIGASHSSEFRMWQEDSLASEGVKELAETGATKKLEAELKQVSSKTRTIIKARELQYLTLNSKTSAVFRADRLHHLVSILSKLSPSPDWMVGVSALELCQSDCTWAQQRAVDLYLWDAGTDSGRTFEAADSPTRPPERIRPMVRPSGSRRPSSENGAPASQQDAQSASEPAKPFARLTITRQRIYEKSCTDDPLAASRAPLSLDWPSSEPSFGQAAPSYADCRLSEWSEWSSCSSRCGKGLRTRTRSFLDERAPQYGCSRADLVAKEVCISECQGSNVCVTRDWGEWSECSVSCGRGLRKRTRAPIDPARNMGRACEDVELAELEPCTGTQGLNCSTEPTSCQVTDWSHWSECSVACGKGTRIRTRQYLRKEGMENCSVKLLQKQPCQGRPELCKHSTKAVLTRHRQQYQITNPDLPVIDCKLSAWSPWSTCSALCGQGKQIRSRYIIQMPQNGGKPCDNKLSRTMRCKDLPPCSPPQSHGKRGGGPSRLRSGNSSSPNLFSATTTNAASSMMDDEDDTRAHHDSLPQQSEFTCVYGEWSNWSECEVVCRPVKKGSQKIRQKVPLETFQQDKSRCPVKEEYYYCDPDVYC